MKPLASHNAAAPVLDKKLVSEMVAAEFLCLSFRTLQNWRVRGGGPRFIRISSRCIRYRISDLEEWIAGRTVSNTSEETSN